MSESELRARVAATLSGDEALNETEVRDLFTLAVKEYFDRQLGEEAFAPVDPGFVSPTEGVVAASALLDAINVEVFELGLWKSWGVVS